ncbi:MAG: AMP-binding protein [Emcibacteraceae bacterium]|nr:AMP-binding protein [Emcibacteraceae bacterium]
MTLIAAMGSMRAGHVVAMADWQNLNLIECMNASYSCDFVFDPKTDRLEVRQSTDAMDLHESLALVLSTSGSTGSSKAVRISRSSLKANSTSIAEYMKIKKTDVALLTLPLHYCYGLSVATSHLLKGAQLVMGSIELTDPNLEALLRQEKVTTFPCVPYSIDILEMRKFRSWNLPDLRYITQAGGALTPKLVQTYANWAVKTEREFFVMYGATEATSRMAYMCAREALNDPSAIGQAMPQGRFSIIDEEGKLIHTPDLPGELVYEGPNIMLGYAETRKDLALGREVNALRTGDIAVQTQEKMYRIVGRLSRFAKLYGKRLNLQDAENKLRDFGYITSIVSDDHTLFVAVEGHAEKVEIQSILSQSFGVLARHVVIELYSALPLLSSGKPDYASLKERFIKPDIVQENYKLSDLGPASELSASGALQKLFEEIFQQTVNHDQSFQKLNGDSLRYVEISMGIEDILGQLPEEWQEMSLTILASYEITSKRKRLIEIEIGIIARILAILFVVANHAGLSFLAGGSATLMLIAGYNLVRFQLPAILVGNARSLAINLFWNVLLPFWGVLLIFGIYKNDLPIYDMLLVGGYLGSGGASGFGAWFIQALIQCIIIIYALVRIKPLRRIAIETPFLFGWIFLAAACALRLMDAILNINSLFPANGGQVSWVLWLFSLGYLIAQARSNTEKIQASIAVIILGPLFYWGDFGRIFYPMIVGLSFLWVPRIILPKLLGPLLYTVGSASLFIYMLHSRAPINSLTSDWPVDFIRISVGIILGVIGWKGYNVGLRLLRSKIIPMLSKW